jgi:hypothetical protein
MMKRTLQIAAAIVLQLSLTCRAADGSWIEQAGGSWINVTDNAVSWIYPTMWSGSVVAYGAGKIADLSNGLDHQVSKTIDLPVDIVLGQLIWRDNGNPNRDLILRSANASHLVMATTTGAPLIWAKNRSIYIDVPISGTKGLNLQSDQGTMSGVTLRQRNDYTGLTTILDGGGPCTVAYPGDFGYSSVLVNGNTSDAGVELDLQHSRALKPGSRLEVQTGAVVDLDYVNPFPGIGDVTDHYLDALILGGNVQPPGIYSAATHPAFFTGSGEIVVQVLRQGFRAAIFNGPPADIHLTWKSVHGKVYDIWKSTDLSSGSWEEIATVASTAPNNQAIITPTTAPAAFYRVEERTEYLPAVRAGVIAKIDSYITNNYLADQNTTPGDIRNGQFHNGDNMRFSECTPVLVWAYLQPDSLNYRNPAVLEAAIRSLDYMVRAQGINGGFNENHGWCGVPVRTNGKSSVTGFTLHALGAAIEMLAGMPVMQPRLSELMDANGTGTNDTVRRSAWLNMLSQAMPYQFSGSGRGHAPNQDLCALMAVYKINDGHAALTNGTLLKTQAEIDTLSNEIFHGQPSAASSRPDGKWFSPTGLLTEGGHGFYGYDGNYGAGVTMSYLGLLAPRDTTAATFLTTKYAEALQYFFVPDPTAKLGVFAENAIARRSTGDPLNTGMLPFALAHSWHPAMERLYEIALPYFAAAPVANISISSPSHLQVGVWNYCEWLNSLSDTIDTGYRLPAERPEAWTFTDTTLKTQVTKPAKGPVTFYTEIWDDVNMARRHTWNQAPETITTLGLFP